ncbi:MAG: (2Fe-2S) ferredoxin domain-containing protein [Ktedonobacterales bacterium]
MSQHESPRTDDSQSNTAPGESDITDRIWERHVFICTSGDWCPYVDGDGIGVHAEFKKLVKAHGLSGHVRVNHSGCLDQCGHGPMVVVYPEAVWYAGVRPDDVEEIVREHLMGGCPVERLRYRNHPGKNKLPRDAQGLPVGRPDR